MANRCRPTTQDQWMVDSVSIKSRDAPQRLHLAYRFLIEPDNNLSPAVLLTPDQLSASRKEASYARRYLCQGFHSKTGKGPNY